MGNISEQSSWQRPITAQVQKGLKLVDGILPPELADELSHQHDPYQLAAYVADAAWLNKLTPRIPTRSQSVGVGVRARHATLLLEFNGDAVLIDPGSDTIIEHANPSMIAITHAHHDHVGGLLIAANLYPQASILMTPETFDLLQIPPDDQANAVKQLIRERGQLHLADGSPLRTHDIDYRFLPAGHLQGAAMIDIQTKDCRVLITGDFALRETGGLPGGVWSTAEYDTVIMESSHGWDTNRPTAVPETNWKSLITACQNAVDDGATRLIVLAAALGEAQDAYFALCASQMRGDFSKFTVRFAGKALKVAELYARLARSPHSIWSNPIRTLTNSDYVPENSIVIVGGFDTVDGMGSRLVESSAAYSHSAVIRPVIGFSNSPGSYTYTVSLHASFNELFATAVALKCRQVALYHGQHGRGEGSSPLIRMLESVGRHVVPLIETPRIVGAK